MMTNDQIKRNRIKLCLERNNLVASDDLIDAAIKFDQLTLAKILVGNLSLHPLKAEMISNEVEAVKNEQPTYTGPSPLPPVTNVTTSPPPKSRNNDYNWWVRGGVAVAVLALAVLVLWSSCKGDAKVAAMSVVCHSVTKDGAAMMICNSNTTAKPEAGDDLGSIKSDLETLKSDVAVIKSAVTATDADGNTASVTDVVQDIQVKMVKKDDLSNLAKTSDLSNLAKTNDLKDLAKTSDLSSLATTKHLHRVQRDVKNVKRELDAHRKATENKTEEPLAPGKVIIVQQ